MCELANGTEPFSGVATTLMLTEKVRGCVPQLFDCTTIPTDTEECHGDCELSNTVITRTFSEDLHELAALCLQKDANVRPTASQLLTHPIFKFTKKGHFLPDILKPAIPLSSRAAINTGKTFGIQLFYQLIAYFRIFGTINY